MPTLILPVTLAGVKSLCGLQTTAQDASVSALIALAQPALEYALDPVLLQNSLSNAGLASLLTLGVTEVLAGEYTQSLWRQPQAANLFRVSTLEVETRPANDLSKIGAALSAQGMARLSPFLLSGRSIARIAFAGDGNMDDGAPVDLAIGIGQGAIGSIGQVGAPPDPTFDRQLGTDGHTEPPAGGYGDFAFPMSFAQEME